MRAFFTKYREYITIILSFSAFAAIWLIFSIPCPIKHLTGISCAGCGMTRALLSALSFNFDAAFIYHPLWVMLLPLTVLLVALKVKRKKLAFNITVGCAAVIFLAVWIFRMISGDEIVAFELENSAVSRLIQKIRGC